MEDAQAALKLVDEASEVGSPVDDDDSLGRLLNHHVALHCWHHQLLTIAPVNKTRTTTPLSTQHTILILVHPCFTSVSRRQNYYPTVILVFRTQLVHLSAECTSITPVYRTPFHTTLSSLLTEHTCITPVSRRYNYYTTTIIVFRIQTVHLSTERTKLLHLSPENIYYTTIILVCRKQLVHLSTKYLTSTPIYRTHNYCTTITLVFRTQLLHLSTEHILITTIYRTYY